MDDVSAGSVRVSRGVDREVTSRRALPSLLAALALWAGCSLEKPDPAAQAAGILHKHPADFIDQLSALETVVLKEIGARSGPTALTESLYAYRSRLQPLMAAAGHDSEKAAILNAWVFDTLKVEPIMDARELETSLPGRVLETRRGSCVGLSLLFLALGETLQLPIYPVFLPGHVFVRYRAPGYRRNFETLRRGLARSDSFYLATFTLEKRPWYGLREREPRQVLAALVFNLGNTHREGRKRSAALAEFRLVEELLPGFPEALGNQGALHLEAGNRPMAKQCLLAALAGDSLAAPAWRNLVTIYRAEGDTAGETWALGRLHRLAEGSPGP